MFAFIFKRTFFSDKPAIILLIGFFILTAINILLVIALLSSRNYQIPVHYSGYNGIGVFERSQWYYLYVFPVFAFVVFAVNSMLSIKIHQLRREYSLAILGLSYLVAVFNIIVSYSFIRAM